MKSKKSLLLAMLALTMVFSLAGCKKKEPVESTTTPKVTTAPTKEAEVQEVVDAAPWTLLEPITKDEGTNTYPRSNYVTYPVDESEAKGVTLTYWMPLPGNVAKNSATVNLTEWARIWKEKTGVTVEFIHPTQGSENEEFAVLVASNKLPDIIEWEWTNSYTGGPAAAEKEGVLILLDEYISEYGSAADLWQYLQDNPNIDKQVKNDNGNYYTFPFIRGSKYLQCTSGMMYRADLLEAAGFTKTPVTISDWTDALTALKANGIDKPMTFKNMEDLQNGLFNAYKLRPGMYIDDTTGKVEYGFAEAGYKEFMLQVNQWVKDGLLDADLLTNDTKTMENYMLTGASAVTYGAGGGLMGAMLTTAGAAPETYGANFNLEAANFPVINSGEMVKYGGASYDYATTSKASAAITADSEHPDLAAKFLNFCYSQQGHTTINFGEEGKSYNMVGDVPTYTDEVMKNPNGLTIAVAMAHWGRGNMSGAFVQDENYIIQYYETEQQKNALKMWNDETDSQSTLIPPITLSEDESKKFTQLNAAVDTYVKEQRARFFTLEGDVSAEWDNYISTLKTMGIDEMISIYQSALDRFNAR